MESYLDNQVGMKKDSRETQWALCGDPGAALGSRPRLPPPPLSAVTATSCSRLWFIKRSFSRPAPPASVWRVCFSFHSF